MSLTVDEHNPWKILSVQTVYDNNWIKVDHFDVITPAGKNGIYGKVHFKNKAIGVIPVDNEGFTYLVGQYRFPLDAYSWEIPEGGCPLEEVPLKAAKRELLEETGMVADEWVLLGRGYLSNSVSDEEAYYYLAVGLTQNDPEPEETEQLTVKKIALKEVFQMVNDGIITDALSIIALQQLELKLLKKEITLPNLF